VHEVVHLHPTKNRFVNMALVYVPVGWAFPLGRFEDGHLEHHRTGALTDPLDDPESWYLASRDWRSLPLPGQWFLRFNNTVVGRLAIGPLVSLYRMIVGDGAAILAGGATGRRVLIAWLAHAPGVLALGWFLSAFSQIPAWQFAAAAYGGMSIILIRTFLEHQASEHEGERTVIIEDRGPLAFLFLYNNLHCVHHTRPGLAWYRIPTFYDRHRAQFIKRNRGYVYRNYWDALGRYLLKPKEPVPHPLWRREAA
jgi:fatty acid desaturase